MHYLHCILVKVEEGEGADEAKQRALDAIGGYGDGDVWDWHEDGPGRWAGVVPDVILGRENREQFLSELEKRHRMPFQEALESAAMAAGWEWGWRTAEEIESGGYCTFPRYGSYGDGSEGVSLEERDGRPRFWSARPQQVLWTLADLAEALWRGDAASDMLWAYHVEKLVRLASGTYDCESYFYSEPDLQARASPETLADARAHPENYALVFVDIHN